MNVLGSLLGWVVWAYLVWNSRYALRRDLGRLSGVRLSLGGLRQLRRSKSGEWTL